jgi:hypothetical protein
MLVADPPPVVAAFDDVDHAGGLAVVLADVGVVVHREEIADLVKGEFLRIAEPGREHLETAAVGIAPQDASFVVERDDAPLGFDVAPAVADAHVEFPVGPELEPVEVVAAVRLADPEAGEDRRPFSVLELPEVRDGGEPDLSFSRDDSRGDAVGDRAESVGEGLRVVGPAGSARSSMRRIASDSTASLSASVPRWRRCMATRSSTVRHARSSSSQSIFVRMSSTDVRRRWVSTT